jgi:Na+/proline symporter
VIRAATWTAIGVAVVLTTRVAVYALSPSESQLLADLENKTGPPQLVGAFTGIALFAALLAAAALWLATVAVRERLALERHELVEAPRLRPLRLAMRAVVLLACTSITFAYFESYIHWREGLGWHGIRCLVGPVHRDAIPLLIALSLLAVALHGAVEHLLSWTRRLVALLAPRIPVVRGVTALFTSTARPRAVRTGSAPVPRGPPVGALV